MKVSSAKRTSLKNWQKGFGRIYQAIVAALLLNFIFIGGGIAQTYNVATDFSTTNNPNGVWSYGWSASRGAEFKIYHSFYKNIDNLDAWHNNGSEIPHVTHNQNSSDIMSVYSSVKVPADKVVFHPGSSCENSIIRWKAPNSGNIKIDALFMGVDFAYPTTTDVAILYNSSTELWSGNINTYNVPTPVSKSLSVSAGDTVDFTVGCGNGGYVGDTTSIDITIEYSCYTKAQIDAAKQEGIDSVKAKPGDYGLFNQTQIDAAKQAGIDMVKANPANYQLFNQTQLDQKIADAVKAEQLKWDANGDGKIGLEDIIRMLQVIVGLRL